MIDVPTVFFTGIAGSGKTYLTKAFYEWMEDEGYSAGIINLDPGVEQLPYVPDVDVREWITLESVMEQYGLGPNGAQIVCADMIALNSKRILMEVEENLRGVDYVLIDTPGQIELFAFRSASRFLIDSLTEKPMLCFLLDGSMCRTPSGFVSQILLSLSTQLRLQVPTVNVLSKADLLDELTIRNIKTWCNDIYTLKDAIEFEGVVFSELSKAIVDTLFEVGAILEVFPISALKREGMEDIYSAVQSVYSAGEDISKS